MSAFLAKSRDRRPTGGLPSCRGHENPNCATLLSCNSDISGRLCNAPLKPHNGMESCSNGALEGSSIYHHESKSFWLTFVFGRGSCLCCSANKLNASKKIIKWWLIQILKESFNHRWQGRALINQATTFTVSIIPFSSMTTIGFRRPKNTDFCS